MVDIDADENTGLKKKLVNISTFMLKMDDLTLELNVLLTW